MAERHVVYDADLQKQAAQQATAPAALSGSVAAIIGHMVAATEGFDIREKSHRDAVVAAIDELLKPWFEGVLKAQATLGRDKVE